MSAAALRTPSQPTQPSRFVLRGNLTKLGGEDVLSTTLPNDQRDWTSTGTRDRVVEVRS